MPTPSAPALPYPGFPDISIRDYFAAAALSGMCANSNPKPFWLKTDHIGDAVLIAYHFADRMMRQRKIPAWEG